MLCLRLSCLNLIIPNGNKNTGAACLKNESLYLVTLSKCRTVTSETGREHTDFGTSNANNPFYHKATFTSLSVSLNCPQNIIMIFNSNYNGVTGNAQRLQRGVKRN